MNQRDKRIANEVAKTVGHVTIKIENGVWFAASSGPYGKTGIGSDLCEAIRDLARRVLPADFLRRNFLTPVIPGLDINPIVGLVPQS